MAGGARGPGPTAGGCAQRTSARVSCGQCEPTSQDSSSDAALWSAEEAHHLAEDCTQETLLAIRSNLAGFRGDSQFTTWAYAIAIRTVLADLRRRRWQKVKREPELLGELIPAWPLDVSTPGPDRSFQQLEAWRILTHLIESDLTPRQRAALVAHAFDEMPLDEVAAWLGTNRDNVYKLLHDARKKLKRALLARGLTLAEVLKMFAID